LDELWVENDLLNSLFLQARDQGKQRRRRHGKNRWKWHREGIRKGQGKSKRRALKFSKRSVTPLLFPTQADEKPEKPEENKEKEEAAAK
jgi:hypothetical protein